MNKNRKRYLDRRENSTKKIGFSNLTSTKKTSADNMENFNIAMVGAFFLSSFFILVNFPLLDLSVFQLFQLYFLFLGISFIIPIKKYRKELTMSMYEYILFNIMAFAPTFICLIFFINSLYSYNKYVETYKIKSFEHSSISIIYTLEDNQYEDKEYLRTIGQKDQVSVKGNNYFSIYFEDGLLGIRKIQQKELY